MAGTATTLDLIRQTLIDVTKKPVTLQGDEDLLESQILDSLDGMQFFLELEDKAGVRFPADDLAEAGFYRVPYLIEYIDKHR